MEVKVKTLSYSLFASGEGDGLIDSDVVYDSFGIPYIPAKRVKGCLKESALEVCEMLGISSQIVYSVFGNEGLEGKIYINNLYINNYEDLKNEIKVLKKEKEFSLYLHPQKVLSHFTAVRYQTAINEDGVAKENSLRTIRVLKPDIEFKGDIYEIKTLSRREKALLYLAVINLKRMGTSRNRGFGEVRCILENSGFENSQEAIDVLLTSEVTKASKNDNKTSSILFDPKLTGENARIKFTVKTLSPVVIAQPRGEQNTVYTKKYIPASVIRGLLAKRLVEILKLGRDAQRNEHFYTLFLSDKTKIGNAYPKKEGYVFYQTPLFIQEEKGSNSATLYNVFDKYEETEMPNNTKPLNKFCYIDDENVYIYEPETTFYFHNNRDREKGHSIGEGIFYYEAINSGEEFEGEIVGDRGYLEELKQKFDDFTAFIGRSKTAQYGLVKFCFGDIEGLNSNEINDTEFIMYAISPIILYNEYGFTQPSENILIDYLANLLECEKEEIEIVDSAARIEKIENFITIWKLKTPSLFAYSAGSSFKVKLKTIDDRIIRNLGKIEAEGIGEEKSLGFGKVKILHDIQEVMVRKKVPEKEDRNSTDIKQSRDILLEIIIRDLLTVVNYLGYRKAEDFKGTLKNWKLISNHLINRLYNMLTESNNFSEWKIKIENLDGKKAGELLKKLGLIEELTNKEMIKEMLSKQDVNKFGRILSKLGVNIMKDSSLKWDIFKNYWLNFLRYLRLFKKQEEYKDEQNC
ncbi:RAMP superfamily CRISPR-associated protein [Caldicellulosiruptor saccharolyticus]|nr:RAMP superfamily CRISPR-associated protein [Caldicellulosiruptor saccharolyticus]